MHRDKKEDCTITFTYGDKFTYKFSEYQKNAGKSRWFYKIQKDQVDDRRGEKGLVVKGSLL